MSSGSSRADLAVVVTVIDGGPALERCLDALTRQVGGLSLDVVVPLDDTVVASQLVGRYPAFRFLSLGPIKPAQSTASAAGQHELYDRRRAAGLRAVDADLVAILEDRGAPRADWAQAMVRLHRRLPYGVIGGAIENGENSVLSWAVYFCDFGRYGLPFAAGPRAWVSDVNVAYKRRVLEATRDIWQHRYHETTVHWALRRAGETLYLSPDSVVDQRRERLNVGGLLAERYAWGRLFAFTRAREVTTATRMLLALSSPLLPVVLFLRLAWQQQKKKHGARFVAAAPATIVLLVAWSLGEATGYLTGRA